MCFTLLKALLLELGRTSEQLCEAAAGPSRQLNPAPGKRTFAVDDSSTKKATLMWKQVEFQFRPKSRGYHLVTDEVLGAVPDLRRIKIGLMHLFLLHTSAGLGINENADPDVRTDMETMMNRIVPEGQPIVHTIEGPDDMPAHVKSMVTGCELTIPISHGRLKLGTWQGIYLCEFRNHGGSRSAIVTIQGEEMA